MPPQILQRHTIQHQFQLLQHQLFLCNCFKSFISLIAYYWGGAFLGHM